MSPRDRRKTQGRMRAPGVEGLEARLMLTSSPADLRPIAPVHLDFSAETAKVAAPHATTKKAHVTAESVKPKAHAAVKPAHAPEAASLVKASSAATVKQKRNPFIDLVTTPAGSGTASGNPYVDEKTTTGTSTKGLAQTTYSPVPGDLTPAQVRKAYGVDQLGAANEGQGETIGIVDEFNDPNILNDTNAFSAEYGLPQLTSSTLKVYKDSYYGAVPNIPSYELIVSDETSLDVEWAHAMAPMAKILLVEVPASGSIQTEFSELLHGVQYAASQPGVSDVSLSYGYNEGAIGTVSALNKQFLATGPSFNVAVTVSAGDYEYPGFPSSSPNVISVGGTALHLADSSGTYGHETGWGGSSTFDAAGGGYSAFFGPPLFQRNNGVVFPYRTLPDVSADADPETPTSIYDSYMVGTGDPWNNGDGTSLASPIVTGILALAQQDRTAMNKPILNSTQIDNLLYQTYLSPTDYAKYFNDVTLGSNNDVTGGAPGYSAKVGYDFATGLGSIKANTVVPYLAKA